MRIRDTIFQISEKPHIKRNHHFQTFPNYVQFWKQNLEPQLQLTVYVHLKNHLVGVNHRLKARMQLFVAPKNDKNTQRIGYTVCVYIYNCSILDPEPLENSAKMSPEVGILSATHIFAFKSPASDATRHRSGPFASIIPIKTQVIVQVQLSF